MVDWDASTKRKAVIWGGSLTLLGVGSGLFAYYGFVEHMFEDKIDMPDPSDMDWDAFLLWLKQWLLDHHGSNGPTTGQPPAASDNGSLSSQAIPSDTAHEHDASHWFDAVPVEAWVLSTVVLFVAVAAYTYYHHQQQASASKSLRP